MYAIWAEEPSSISDEKYPDFYKYLANAFDEPLDRMHYQTDAPVEIKALFYPALPLRKIWHGPNGTQCFLIL